MGPTAVGNGFMKSASSLHYLSLGLSCVQVELNTRIFCAASVLEKSEGSNHMLQGTWYTSGALQYAVETLSRELQVLEIFTIAVLRAL